MSVVDGVRFPTVDWQRCWRLCKYGLVGASGVVVDMLAVWLAFGVGGVHYLSAQVVAFAVAVTWNFSLNYHWTFGQPDGSLPRQYCGYVGIQLGALATRLGIVYALVEWTAAPVLFASLVGIVVPAVLGFLGVERVFGRWSDGS